MLIGSSFVEEEGLGSVEGLDENQLVLLFVVGDENQLLLLSWEDEEHSPLVSLFPLLFVPP